MRGEVSTGKEGMTDTGLGPGGFAMMAQQTGALVQLHGERRVPDVRDIRPGIRRRVG